MNEIPVRLVKENPPCSVSVPSGSQERNKKNFVEAYKKNEESEHAGNHARRHKKEEALLVKRT